MDNSEGGQFSHDLREQIASAMMVLSYVEYGDYDARIAIDLPDQHPLAALLQGINDMISWLAVAQSQREAHLLELRVSQREALLELSSPIIEVMEGVLCLPLVGAVDEVRGAKMTEDLLAAVNAKGVCRVVLDFTAIKELDAAAIAEIVRMIKSTQLLGASCAISGISARIARMFVDDRLEFPDVPVFQTLRDAIHAEVKAFQKRR